MTSFVSIQHHIRRPFVLTLSFYSMISRIDWLIRWLNKIKWFGDRTSGPMLPKHCKTDSLNDLVDDVIHVADDRIFSSVNPNQSVNHNQSEQSAKYLLVMVFNPFLHLRFKVTQCGFILSIFIPKQDFPFSQKSLSKFLNFLQSYIQDKVLIWYLSPSSSRSLVRIFQSVSTSDHASLQILLSFTSTIVWRDKKFLGSWPKSRH